MSRLRVETTRLAPWPWMALLAALVVAGASSAEPISVGYTGTIDEIDAGLAALLPPQSPIALGAPIVVNYSYESTTPDTDPANGSGIYAGAITSFTLYIGSQVFEHAPGGPTNEIDILVDALLNVYQPVDSVTASPPLPIAANLEADVIFLAVRDQPLVDDSLVEPPAPGDPGWSSAEAAITDDMHNKLINVTLDQRCAGACPPPFAEPVPTAPPILLVCSLGGLGARRLRRALQVDRRLVLRSPKCWPRHAKHRGTGGSVLLGSIPPSMLGFLGRRTNFRST